MILGVGIDVVDVDRFAATIARTPALVQKVFTPGERERGTASLAARFAAKEAALKALGLAGRGVGWRQIEVQSAPSGACALVLHGEADAFARQAGVAELALSLSHEGDYATAVVVGTSTR